MSIGDGMKGKRSERLGMPQLFEAHDLDKWYQEDLYRRVEKFFKPIFPEDRIRVSKAEAFPG